MRRKTTIKEAKLFHTEFCKLLRDFGAVEVDYRPRKIHGSDLPEATTFKINTKAGELKVIVEDDSLYCQFEDVPLAKTFLYSNWNSHLNPFSGKWNFHYGKIDDITKLNSALINFDYELHKVL